MSDSTTKRNRKKKASASELPAAKGRVIFDPWSCRTCKVCEVACSIAKEGQARPALARMNIIFDEFNAEAPISGLLCRQCEDAPCIEACPVGAMGRDAHTGAVVVDAEVCVGCMKCAEACPWDIPKKHSELDVAIKWDLCLDREGGPLCVEVCPLKGKALRYEPHYYELAVES